MMNASKQAPTYRQMIESVTREPMVTIKQLAIALGVSTLTLRRHGLRMSPSDQMSVEAFCEWANHPNTMGILNNPNWLTCKQIASKHGVSVQTVERWIKHRGLKASLGRCFGVQRRGQYLINAVEYEMWNKRVFIGRQLPRSASVSVRPAGWGI